MLSFADVRAARERIRDAIVLTPLVRATGPEVAHARAFADISVRDVEIVMLLETRGTENVSAVMKLLEEHGIAVRQHIRGIE